MTLTWDVTVREDDNLEPCKGGRNWKVRFSEYNGNNAIPEDFSPEKGDSTFYSPWENVHGKDTNHTLNFTFATDLYYLFEVGHRADKLNQSDADEYVEVFASHVFYFGKQG